MNQILITGDEPVVEKVTKKVVKEKKKLPIKPIITFYAISIIILGICIICGTLYGKSQVNKTVEANKKPEIKVERSAEEHIIELKVTHIREISTVSYKWNDEDEIIIGANGQTSIKETIPLKAGVNKLRVVATDQSGKKQTYEKSFTANIPEIEILERVDNGVKIYVGSDDEEIEYLEYSWDDGEMQKITVEDNEYEGIINAPIGLHVLRIKAIDTAGKIAEFKTPITGDTDPKIVIAPKMINGKATFVVDIEDDELIKTVQIVHNQKLDEKRTIEVNEPKYHTEVEMTEGEVNTLMITVINKNDLQTTKGVRFENIDRSET